LSYNNDQWIISYNNKENISYFPKILENNILDKEIYQIMSRCLLYRNLLPRDIKMNHLKKLKEIAGKGDLEISKILFFYFLTDSDNDDQMKFWGEKCQIQQFDILDYFEDYDQTKDDDVKYLLGVCIITVLD